MNTTIKHYRFYDAKRGMLAVAVLHFLLGIMLWFSVGNPEMPSIRPYFCLFVAISCYLIYKYYNWSDNRYNILCLLGYGLVLVGEWQWLGIPESIVKSPVGIEESKGFLVDIVFNLLPFVYVGLRVMGAVFLIQIIRTAHSISRDLNSPSP